MLILQRVKRSRAQSRRGCSPARGAWYEVRESTLFAGFMIFVALVILVPNTVGSRDHNPEPGGELEGRLRRSDGKAETVVMRFHRAQLGQGRIRMRLGPEGERYVGEYIRIDPRTKVATVRRFYVGWAATQFDDLSTGPLGRSWVRETYSVEIFRDRLKDEVVATLSGDQGGRMRCRFELDSPSAGLAGGASGACQTDQGEVVEFPARKLGVVSGGND